MPKYELKWTETDEVVKSIYVEAADPLAAEDWWDPNDIAEHSESFRDHGCSDFQRQLCDVLPLRDDAEVDVVIPDPDAQKAGEPNNDSRASRAAEALAVYMKSTGADPDTALSDLLCDLRRWADRHGGDFEADLQGANQHYTEETQATKEEAIA